MNTRTLYDKEFGTVSLHERSTARRLIFRVREGQLSVTVPPYTRIETVKEVVDSRRPDLRRLFARYRPCLLLPGQTIHTRTFTIVIASGEGRVIQSRLHDNILHITLPAMADHNDPRMQEAVASIIHRHLKKAAEEFLPQRLEYWARLTGNSYNGVSIGRGTRRLGSCRVDRHITLSYHLMYLPERLIDYVILHELSHLSEMNHSARFHDICNRYCNGNELILRKELRNFRFPTGR